MLIGKHMPLTLVLPIVRLDIITISSGNSIVLQFGLDEQSQTLVLNIYLYQKAKRRFRRTNFKFPTIGNTCSLAASWFQINSWRRFIKNKSYFVQYFQPRCHSFFLRHNKQYFNWAVCKQSLF